MKAKANVQDGSCPDRLYNVAKAEAATAASARLATPLEPEAARDDGAVDGGQGLAAAIQATETSLDKFDHIVAEHGFKQNRDKGESVLKFFGTGAQNLYRQIEVDPNNSEINSKHAARYLGPMISYNGSNSFHNSTASSLGNCFFPSSNDNRKAFI